MTKKTFVICLIIAIFLQMGVFSSVVEMVFSSLFQHFSPSTSNSSDFWESDNLSPSPSISAPWKGGVASSFSYGDGSASDPYMITSAEELALLAEYVNNNNPTYNNSSVYYALACDIDLGTVSWQPIGVYTFSENSPPQGFCGTFDGRGYTIQSLHLNQSASDSDVFGLFGASSGTIENVCLRDSFISLTPDTTITGSLCGFNSGRIYGCSAIGVTIYQETTDNLEGSIPLIGGLVGVTQGSVAYSYVTSLSSTVSAGSFGALAGACSGELIQCLAEGSIYLSAGNLFVGGLVGFVQGESRTTISQCATEISILNGIGDHMCEIGGLIGYADNCSIQHCMASGQIIRVNADSVGGLIGYLSNTYVGYSYSDVTIDSCAAHCQGGFVGTAQFSSSGPYNPELYNCSALQLPTGFPSSLDYVVMGTIIANAGELIIEMVPLARCFYAISYNQEIGAGANAASIGGTGIYYEEFFKSGAFNDWDSSIWIFTDYNGDGVILPRLQFLEGLLGY